MMQDPGSDRTARDAAVGCLPVGGGLKEAVVLVVEDDETVGELIAASLGPEVFAVQIASSLAQARRMLDCSYPDVIILDRRLPDGDGADLCADLKRRMLTKAIPVLFLSAHMGIEDRFDYLKSGADDCMSKPFEPRELRMRLNALWRRAGRRGPATPFRRGSSLSSRRR